MQLPVRILQKVREHSQDRDHGKLRNVSVAVEDLQPFTSPNACFVQRGGADPSAQSDEGTSKLNHRISTCARTFRVGFVALQDLNAMFGVYPEISSPE